MSPRIYLRLWMAGLVLGCVLLWLKPYTGYMDADYYYAGAKTLYAGKGFTDFTLWNYLNKPLSLPGPSHTYWMPLASILAWLGMLVAGNHSLLAARVPFLLLFSFVPPMMGWLSWRCWQNRSRAIASGLLVLVSGYFLKFVTEPDGFAPLFLAGIGLIALLREPRQNPWRAFALGLLAGLIHLTRADGLAWMGLLFLYLMYEGIRSHLRPSMIGVDLLLLLAGYLIPTAPWYWRNITSFGQLMTSGGFKAAYLVKYDQLFTYPAELLNFQTWWAAGPAAILGPRWQALKINLLSLWAVFCLIVLPPFIWLGVRKTWRKGISAFLLLAAQAFFGVMTFVFPLVGLRGGLLHSGAIFMPAVWLVVPAGVAAVTEWLRSKPRFSQMTEGFMSFSLISILTLVTGFVLWLDFTTDVSVSQADTWQTYANVDAAIATADGAQPYTILVNNPPAYYVATGQQAIAIPYGDLQTIRRVATDFKAQYLAMDGNYTETFPELYQDQTHPPAGFTWLGRVDGLTIFRVEGQP